MSMVGKNAVAADEAAGNLRRHLVKAIVQVRIGAPDTLQLVNAEVPDIGAGDVLLQVVGGVGLTRPKSRIAGVDVAGRVAEVGAEVRDLEPADEVFGFARGAFAEFAAALVVPSRPGCPSSRRPRCRWPPSRPCTRSGMVSASNRGRKCW